MPPPPPELGPLPLIDGICYARPQGESTLVATVDLVKGAILQCRERQVTKLLFNGTGLSGVSLPSLVDCFLMVEDWALAAERMVIIAVVTHPEYLDPKKFGVALASDLGLVCEAFTCEQEALRWLGDCDGAQKP